MDIQKKAELEYLYWVTEFKDELVHFNEALKLECIEVKRVEINQNIAESDYRIWFPVRGLESHLTACLETYFRGNSMSQATGVKYNPSMSIGDHKYSSVTKKITVKPISKFSLVDSNFNFGLMDFFKPLIQYLTWCKMMDELNEMDAVLRKKKRMHPKSILRKMVFEKEGFRDEPGTEKLYLGASSNKFPQIFNEGAYDLFCYLDMEFTKTNSMPIAKYSNIFRFLKYEQLIICTQLEYIRFIEDETGEKMSKILPQNFKYTDTILPLLKRLKSDFDKRIKIEHY
jgi:hypothetical protein